MPRRLSLLVLEDRATPVVWNNPWADPGHLTVSFAPDGTVLRGKPSALFGELESIPTADWQREALRAFQTWAAQANINLAVVPDTAVAFGTPGPVQGDPRKGDIRLGATSLGTGQLAAATPFDLLGGWSGSVLLNTDRTFTLDGRPGTADLYTVLLQEAGHVFGVGNSGDPDSAMYEQYQGPRDGLAAADVADIQALYGARTPDPFEGRRGNGTPKTATAIAFATSPAQLTGAKSVVRAADLTTVDDVDVYSVRVPRAANTFTARLQTSGVSLLTARLTVLNAAGKEVASEVATDPLSGDLTVRVADAKPGAMYFLRVEGAQDDVFGIGAYRLSVGTTNALGRSDPRVVSEPARGPNTVHLGTLKQGPDRRWDFTQTAALTRPSEVDTYTVRTRRTTPGTLVVALWGTQPGGLDPAVSVVDRAGRPVPADVLADAGGVYTLQVRDVRPNTTYAIRVAAADPTVPTNQGEYFVGIDFRDEVVTRATFAKGTLTAAEPDVAATMTVAQSQLLHFALSTVTADSQVESAVRLSVLDFYGREVFTLFADAGQSAAGDVLLAAGHYTLVITGGTRSPEDALPELSFTLEGLVRNDPIGTKPIDPSADPPPPPPPDTTTTRPYEGPYTGPYRPL